MSDDRLASVAVFSLSHSPLATAMSISRAEVEKVSLLARLLLSDDELDRMTSQLGEILGYVDLLSELDTEQVEPMAHALDVANVFRDDVGAAESGSGVGPGQRPAPRRGMLPGSGRVG